MFLDEWDFITEDRRAKIKSKKIVKQKYNLDIFTVVTDNSSQMETY